jgi:hypothetical protein
MVMNKKKKTFAVYLLIVLIVFQSISGLFGGIGLLINPNGSYLKMPLFFLRNTPFKDYLIPALVLFFILGVYPTFIAVGLIFNLKIKWTNIINIYKDQHWVWTYSLYLGIILSLWIDFQVMFIGYWHFIQTIYALLGIAILIIALLPNVKNYYKLTD